MPSVVITDSGWNWTAMDVVAAVAHSLHHPVLRPSARLQLVGEPDGGQRVVASRFERVAQPGEHAPPVVADHRGLAVPRLGGQVHRAPERRHDRLMAQADAEDGDPPREPLDEGDGVARLLGPPRAG